MTLRQIKRLHEVLTRRRNWQRADMIEAVAVAFDGKPNEEVRKLRERD